MKYIPNDSRCFVCGDANPKGLQQRYWIDGEFIVTRLTGRKEFAGHAGLHGSIAAALIDEAMGLSSTLSKRRLCVTAELVIRYLKPLQINGNYLVKGRLTEDKKILCKTYGEIIDENLTVFIKATGQYVPLSKKQSQQVYPDVFSPKIKTTGIPSKGAEKCYLPRP